MKKYLFTLSTLALSLGMTHAADGVLTVSDEDAGAASTVFGGGSVVDHVDLIAGMTLDGDAADGEDAAGTVEVLATNSVKKKKVRKPDVRDSDTSSDEEEGLASPSGENAPTFPDDAAEASEPAEASDAEVVREGIAGSTASTVEADAGSPEDDKVNTAEEGAPEPASDAVGSVD